MARLKFGMITRGVRVDAAARPLLGAAKTPIRTRSGVSGGLDLVLPGRVHVMARVDESEFALGADNGRLAIFENGRPVSPVAALPKPDFYDRRLSDGEWVRTVGQLCSADRLCIGMTRHCVFWKSDRRCAYCTIGKNIGAEHADKDIARIVETVLLAAADPVQPARHILIGGGTPNDDDRGAVFAAEATTAIKAAIDIPIYVMIAPPSDLDDIIRLRDAGVDELGMNVEFFSEAALRLYTPGKHRLIGVAHHYKALEMAVRAFGPVNTRSIAIVGLEPAHETVRGATALAAMGVMPILSPFQPLEGSRLSRVSGFTPEHYVDVWEEARDAVEAHGLPLGPTCVCCQNNVLAMPFGPHYRSY